MKVTYTIFRGPTDKPWVRVEREGKEQEHHQLSVSSYKRLVRVLNSITKLYPPVLLDCVMYEPDVYWMSEWRVAWQMTIPDSRERRSNWWVVIDRYVKGVRRLPQTIYSGMTEDEAYQKLVDLRIDYAQKGFDQGPISAMVKDDEVVYIYVEHTERILWHTQQP